MDGINGITKLTNYSYQAVYPQTVYITDERFVLDKLIVQVIDKDGNILNSGNGSFSFSLEIEYEED